MTDETEEFEFRLRLEKEQAPALNPARSFASGANEALAGIASAPIDISNFTRSLLRQIDPENPMLAPLRGTGEDLKALGREAGVIDPEGTPETGFTRAGRIAGASIPGLGAVGTAARVGKTLGPLTPMVESFKKAPGAFAATEAVSAAGAGVGSEIGRAFSEEDSTLGPIVGEIIGGIVSPLAVTTLPKLPTLRLVRRVAKPFTKGGAEKVAAGVVQEVVPDPTLTRARANEFEALPGTKFSVAERSGSDRLLSLEQAVANKIPELKEDLIRNAANNNEAVKQALTTGANVDDARAFLQGEARRLKSALDARMAGAMRRAQDQVNRLRARGTREDASRVLSRELEDALSDSRIQEKELWDSLPGEEMVGRNAAKQAYDDWVGKETPVPDFVRSFLKGKRASKPRTFKEVKEFRSKVLRMQKFSRAQGNAEQAFILNKINQGILDDIVDSHLGADFDTAVNFSRQLNDRFTRGAVGKALRFAPEGGRAIPPELVSENLVPASNAPKAAEGVRRARIAAGGAPEVPRDAAALEGGLRDLIRTRLFAQNGEFDAARAQRFLQTNDELLRQFPDLQQEIGAAVSTQAGVERLAQRVAQAEKNFVSRSKTAAGIILGSSPGDEINAILRNPNRQRMLAQAVRVTRKDPQARAGLKSSYFDEVLKNSLTAARDINGEQLVSGVRMREFVDSNIEDVLKAGLLDKGDHKRLLQIIQNAMVVEARGTQLQPAEQALLDKTNMLEDLIVRVVGAKAGAAVGQGSIGSSLVLAQAGSNALRKVIERLPTNRVTEVLGRAMQDDALMNDLLVRNTNEFLIRKSSQRLNAWLTDLGIQVPELVEDVQTDLEAAQ